jgi:hypothetical protein
MIEEFIDWVQEKRPLLEGQGISVATTLSPPSANPSARMDLDTAKAIARITLWADGSFHMEAIDVERENTIFERHSMLSSPVNFDLETVEFLKLLAQSQ